jgi:hypothetical protein
LPYSLRMPSPGSAPGLREGPAPNPGGCRRTRHGANGACDVSNQPERTGAACPKKDRRKSHLFTRRAGGVPPGAADTLQAHRSRAALQVLAAQQRAQSCARNR